MKSLFLSLSFLLISFTFANSQTRQTTWTQSNFSWRDLHDQLHITTNGRLIYTYQFVKDQSCWIDPIEIMFSGLVSKLKLSPKDSLLIRQNSMRNINRIDVVRSELDSIKHTNIKMFVKDKDAPFGPTVLTTVTLEYCCFDHQLIYIKKKN